MSHETRFPRAYHLLGVYVYTAWRIPALAHHCAMVVLALEALEAA